MNKQTRLTLLALLTAFANSTAASAQDVVTYYHADAIGSVRMMTSATGTVLERHDFLPFGEEWVPPSPNPERRLFAGKERDSESALDYFGARYYVSGTGRFVTVDPILDVQSALVDPQRWNRYSYVSNRPMKFVDPDGRDPLLITGGVGALVYAAWNTYVNVQQGLPWYQNAGVEASKGFLVGATLGLAAPALLPSEIGMGITAGSVTGGAVARAIGSPDAAIRFEGETGSFLESKGLLKAFNVNLGGRQVDAIAGETRSFVVEMTTGKGGGKIAQAAAQAKATGLDVIIYGRNLTGGFVKEALRQGYRVARSPDELE